MKRRLTAAVAACALALAGCGGHHHTTTPAAQSPAAAQACNPAAGQGHPGVCAQEPAGLTPRTVTSVTGRVIPDVYEGNGCKNWAAAKGSIAGGIVKAFEYRTDSCLASNWRGLTAAGIWHAAYDFLRPSYTITGGTSTSDACQVEADRYVAAVNTVGGFNSGPAIADAEVPLPSGFVACWVARIKHDTGMTTVIVYTAPGTWPGGGNPGADLWVASYGPTPGCVWTCTHVAWQFTDGSLGPFPHTTAVGQGDISLDDGITNLLAHPTPADPYPKAPNTLRAFDHGRVHAREHNTLVTALRLKCRMGRARPGLAGCRSSKTHALLLIHRLDALATDHGRLVPGKQKWAIADRGVRHAYLAKALTRR